jgi:energy-coupling factor transport system ATP-binding protein
MAIEVSNLTFVYNKGTFLEKTVLNKINLKIEKGEIAGIFGNTGTGKSTLLYLIKRLLRPTSGRIKIKENLRASLLFQNPYYQLFETTVFEDVSFSLKNLPIYEKEKKVREILERFSLNYEEIKYKSPFSLSFGEMKKIAISGIIVGDFDIFLFDEPVSSLDYKSKKIFFEIVFELKEKGKTVIISSNTLEDFFEIVDRIIILNEGKIVFEGTQKELIENRRIINIELPQFVKILIELKKYKDLNLDIKTREQAKEEIIKCLS